MAEALSLFCSIVRNVVARHPGIRLRGIAERLPRADKQNIKCALRALVLAGQVNPVAQEGGSAFYPKAG